MEIIGNFYTFSWARKTSGDYGKRASELEKGGWENLEKCWSVLENIGDGNGRVVL
jgi:hypothetical protein